MLLIMGCTAGGKGKLAFELARRLEGEILSIDSMKVYRGMDIGTAKPSRQVTDAIKHHLIDVVEPHEAFSLGRYLELAQEAISTMRKNNCPVIAVGGTAMYIKGLLEGIFDGPSADPKLRDRLRGQAVEQGLNQLHDHLRQVDPSAAEKIHPNDAKRIIRALEVYVITGRPISSYQKQFDSGQYQYNWRLIGLRREKAELSRRINLRVKNMIDQGLVQEVKSLLDMSLPLSPQASVAVGYSEIIDFLAGQFSLEEAIEKIKINTRRLAKGQRTWFRRFLGVEWFDVTADDTVTELADQVMQRLNL